MNHGTDTKRLRGLLFDVDGTLADTEETHRRAFNAAFRDYGLGWHWSVDSYRELLAVAGARERMRHYLATSDPAADLDDSAVEQLYRAKTAHYAHAVAGGEVSLRPGIGALLRHARHRGLRLGIATTTAPANVETLLTATLGPAAVGWFDVIAAGDSVAVKKPAPDVYLLALARLGLNAGQCVAFEDSSNGLRAATGAGLCTIVTPCQWTTQHDFTDADLVLPSLEFGADGRTALTLDQLEVLLASRTRRGAAAPAK